MVRFSIALIASAALLPAAVVAQEPPPVEAPMDEHRLSPEEVEKVLEEAAARRRTSAAPTGQQSEEPRRRGLPVHGEVGFAIGTGGYRAAHGTAVVGLPGEGQAILSVGTSRLPHEPFYYRYR